MENTARALEIAAGVLLAVMILSLIAYFFSNLSTMPTQENESMTTEQLHEFNTEYEVYRKSMMYGVDVISCLNKAYNNNKKYSEGQGFLSGQVYSDSEGARNVRAYYVDVYVRVQRPLKESLELYNIKNNIEDFYTPPGLGFEDDLYRKIENTKMGQVGFTFPTIGGVGYTTFNENTNILPKADVKLDGAGYLVPGGGIACPTTKFTPEALDGHTSYYSLRESPEIARLLQYSGNNMIQTVTNNTRKDYDIYTRILWYTALYDMKTMKFKCDYVEYSADTGRVVALYFTQTMTPKEQKAFDESH